MHAILDIAASITGEVFATLCSCLPRPLADSPAHRAARDETAKATVAAMHPVNALEALVAAQIVATDAHGKDCFHLAVQAGGNVETARRLRAQGLSMMRHSMSALRALDRIQSIRARAAAAMHPVDMERAGYWFQEATIPLAEPPPVPAEVPEPLAPEPADAASGVDLSGLPPSEPTPSEPTPGLHGYPARVEAEPVFVHRADASRYAAIQAEIQRRRVPPPAA